MFSARSLKKEIIDLGPEHYHQTEYENCQLILFKINKLMGTLRDTKHFISSISDNKNILDIGCGAGGFVKYLAKQFPHKTFIGIDSSAIAINQANDNKPRNAQFIVQNIGAELPPADIIMATLVFHHLSNDEIIKFLKSHSKQIILINDLHRHPIAYYSYKVLSKILYNNRLIHHDGALSILRSFSRKEIIALLESAEVKNYQIKWRFPFRYQVVIKPNKGSK